MFPISNIKVAIIAGYEATSQQICDQLTALWGAYITFIPMAAGRYEESMAQDVDLILVSSHIIFTRSSPAVINKRTEVQIIGRTLSKAGWEKIKNLPDGNYMVVNDERDSAVETISLIYELGLRNVNLLPCYPDVPELPKAAIAITPGERSYVPSHIEHVIDLGERVVDISTMVEMLTRFHLLNHETTLILNEYAKNIVSRSQGLQATMQGLIHTKNLFEETLNMVQDGVVTYDERGKITFLNKVAEEILALPFSRVANRDIRLVLREMRIDTSFLDKDLQNQLITIRSQNILVNNMKILSRGNVAEGVITFKIAKEVEELELKLRTQLRTNGHTARFHFSDIVTNSSLMKRLVSRAQRMAPNDLGVLILGENGTGKELFAHSLHNASLRANFPFVAVNCSALPESLLETELFGYEDGAFTGAKKGGKPGLFEQAHRGTIFLDEIGDISPHLQTRLLRVVQQKEIIKVGGTKVLPVDVRVIAATNRNLVTMMKEDKFREDLYYRLKVLQIEVPPLRERKEDIPYLVQHFLKKKKVLAELPEPIMAAITQYQWPGNIRELENTIEYLSIMNEGDLQIEDLPFSIGDSINQAVSTSEKTAPLIETNDSSGQKLVPADYAALDVERLLLELILEAKIKGLHTGRKNLIKLARERGILLTESLIRKQVDLLREKGLVNVQIGRAGCQLTTRGYAYIKNQKQED
ncbi:sigma-54 interaction domain-containing protein [Brevibacillus reuszeri]|uniref:sigma-54 interaction domain-containing protein n=1 Tax=Brevibacillus reuszeri TaxID=54915 RepID=UPI00289E4C13|nr:sigma 54-interacting transcriptional regulator [Brevibacillus reuszeri]